MPDYAKNIVYLSQAQYAELIANQSITVDGVTVTYNENDIYVTPQAEPVTDVRVNGTSVLSDGIANVPVAGSSSLGVVKGSNYVAVSNDGALTITPASTGDIKVGTNFFELVPARQHASTFYGLAKAAGDTTQSQSNNAVGTYTDDAKAAIRTMLSTVGIEDYATSNTAGVIKIGAEAYGLAIDSNGQLMVAEATTTNIKEATGAYRPLTAPKSSAIAFYGLAKAAGDSTQTASSNPVGTYTDDAKSAIQQMLDVPSTDDIPEVPVQDVRVNNSSVLNNGIANIPVAHTARYGAMKAATADEAKAGAASGLAVSTYGQHNSVFYGLSKIAGVDLANETVTLGTYPDTAKAAIKTMLGVTDPTVTDVQVNGVSVLGQNGVANVPIANSSSLGVVKVGESMGIDSNGAIDFKPASGSDVIAATSTQRAITPKRQHEATFFGLAKAAGDTSQQSAGASSFGNYTESAKSAISQMLNSAVSVAGTTPTITALPGIRYTCGEVTTLDITPPASGDTEIIFSSGSTSTVLTVPNTIKWPVWFNPASLVANTTYDIIITDGALGMVMAWT